MADRRAVDTAELLAIARLAADRAVERIHRQRPTRLEVTAKASVTDMVTDMDRASEEIIRSAILGARPDDRIVGEEEGDVGGADAEVVWYVDPIDGTTNYVYDHPGYNVSIAAAVGGRTVVGVVADPTHTRTYWAVHGQGAYCDGVRLELPAEAPTLGELLVATGFGYDPARRGRQGAVVAQLLPLVRDIRRMGAAAMDLCSVASGRVDAYYEIGLSVWDLAAGSLIAAEAGARVGSIGDGAQRGDVLVAHPLRYEELRELLRDLAAHTV